MWTAAGTISPATLKAMIEVPSGAGGPVQFPRPWRVAAIDDHPVVVAGIVSVLERAGEPIEWLGAATTWGQLQALLKTWAHPPDLVFVDLYLGDGSTPEEVISALTAQGIRALVVTSERRPVPIRSAMAAGAVGLVLKSDPPERIGDVLAQLRDGQFAVSSDLAYVIVTDEELMTHLTDREVEILRLLSQGYTRAMVAASLDPPAKPSTVNTHINRCAARYRERGITVSSTVDLLRAADADGYLGGDPH